MTEEEVKAYVRSLPPHIFGLQTYEHLSCARLKKGLHHLNFKLVVSDTTKTCTAVVRLPATAEDQEALTREVWYLEKLKSDVTPNILFHATASSLGMPVLITAFVPGAHIAFSRLTEAQIGMLAKKLTDVHSIKENRYSSAGAVLPTFMGTYRNYARAVVYEDIDKPYERARSIPHDDKTVSRARTLLDRMLNSNNDSWGQNEFSLCHGDIGIYNVLWTEHDLRLIDWDGARFGDPADDIAYIFAINQVSSRWRSSFLNTYSRLSPTQHIQSRIEIYLLKNYLFDVVWSMGKLLEEQENRSLVKLARGEYQVMYEERLTALKRYLIKTSRKS